MFKKCSLKEKRLQFGKCFFKQILRRKVLIKIRDIERIKIYETI